MKKQNEEKKEVIINMKKITCSFIKDKKLLGFTLAEVLITLTIIGVVAALTIPSLLANINDKTYDAKRQGFETRLAQALSQIDALNGYEDKDEPADNSTMNFLTNGLSKVYKLSNVCEYDKFSACDYPAQMGRYWSYGYYYTKDYDYANKVGVYKADNLGGLATKGAAFRTRNGESAVVWYNPRCVSEQDPDESGKKLWTREVCLFGYVDLDGAKRGPNSIGRDINPWLVLHPDTPFLIIINPMHVGGSGGATESVAYSDAVAYCKEAVGSIGYSKGSFTLPPKEVIYGIGTYVSANRVWTASAEGSSDDDYAWMINADTAYRVPRSTHSNTLRCFLDSMN